MDLFNIMDQICEADLDRAFANMTVDEKIRFITGLEALQTARMTPSPRH